MRLWFGMLDWHMQPGSDAIKAGRDWSFPFLAPDWWHVFAAFSCAVNSQVVDVTTSRRAAQAPAPPSTPLSLL